jgi:hypothetical protein
MRKRRRVDQGEMGRQGRDEQEEEMRHRSNKKMWKRRRCTAKEDLPRRS